VASGTGEPTRGSKGFGFGSEAWTAGADPLLSLCDRCLPRVELRSVRIAVSIGNARLLLEVFEGFFRQVDQFPISAVDFPEYEGEYYEQQAQDDRDRRYSIVILDEHQHGVEEMTWVPLTLGRPRP
jgi:hypothetical protein